MRVVVHRDKIAELLGPTGEVGRKAERAAGRARDRAKENVSVDKGLLRNSIVAEIVPGGDGPYTIVWRIGTPLDYGLWQEVGTPPIFARRAPVLSFVVNGRRVFAYSTSGVPAQRYLTRAIDATTARDFL